MIIIVNQLWTTILGKCVWMDIKWYKYKVVISGIPTTFANKSRKKWHRKPFGDCKIWRSNSPAPCGLRPTATGDQSWKCHHAVVLLWGVTSTFLWLKTRGSLCWRGTNSEPHDFWHTNWPQDFGPNHRTNRNKSREFAMLKRDQIWSDSSWPASEAMSHEGCMAYQPSWGLDFVEKSWCRCRCQTTEWSCLIILVGPLPRFWQDWIHPHLGHRFLWSLQCFALPWLFCGSWLFQPLRRRRTRVMGTIPCLGRISVCFKHLQHLFTLLNSM